MPRAQQMDMGTQFWAGAATLMWLRSARVLVRLCAPRSHPCASQRCFPALAPGPGELSVQVLGVLGAASPILCFVGSWQAQGFGSTHARSIRPFGFGVSPAAVCLGLTRELSLCSQHPCASIPVPPLELWGCGHSGVPTLPSAAAVLSSLPGWCTTGRRGSPRAMASASTRTRRRRSAPCATSTGASSAAGPCASTTPPARRTRRSSRVSQLWGVLLGPALAALQGLSLVPGWQSWPALRGGVNSSPEGT